MKTQNNDCRARAKDVSRSSTHTDELISNRKAKQTVVALEVADHQLSAVTHSPFRAAFDLRGDQQRRAYRESASGARATPDRRSTTTSPTATLIANRAPQGLGKIMANLEALAKVDAELGHKARVQLEGQLKERGAELPPIRSIRLFEIDSDIGAAIMPEAIELATAGLRRVGIEPVFVIDDDLDEIGLESDQISETYRQHHEAKGLPEWSWVGVVGRLYAGNRGWATMGKDLATISSDSWVNAPAQFKAMKQAQILLHELGHTFGLRHEPKDPSYTHSNESCVMAHGTPEDPKNTPVCYCPGCAGHLNHDVAELEHQE